MAPSKTSRAAHDDDKTEGTAPVKEKARRTNNTHSNGKLQRVASSTGSKLQELTSAAAAASATAAAAAAAAAAQDTANPPGVRPAPVPSSHEDSVLVQSRDHADR